MASGVRPLSAPCTEYRARKYQLATVGWSSASKPQKWYVFTGTLTRSSTHTCCSVPWILNLAVPSNTRPWLYSVHVLVFKCFTVPSSFQPPTSYVPRWLLPRIRIRICIRALILILPLLESTHFSFLQLPISSGLRSHIRLWETTIPSPVSCVPGHDTPIRMRDTIDPRLTA